MVRITQATQHDFPQVRSLFLEYMQWLVPMIETKWGYRVPVTAGEAAELSMAVIQKFMPPDGRLFLAHDESDVIGCACAWTLRPGVAEIKRVYVRPDRRSCGSGRALIQTILTDLRDAGYKSVRLDTAAFMTAAEKLYRSLGFQEIEPYEESETPKDMRHNAIFLELTL